MKTSKSIFHNSYFCSSTLYVQYFYAITYTTITGLKQYRFNGYINRYILLTNLVSLYPFYKQSHSHVKKNRKYAKIPSNYRKTYSKNIRLIFLSKNTAAFSAPISKSSRDNNVKMFLINVTASSKYLRHFVNIFSKT